jgi:hypothetical protein
VKIIFSHKLDLFWTSTVVAIKTIQWFYVGTRLYLSLLIDKKVDEVKP